MLLLAIDPLSTLRLTHATPFDLRILPMIRLLEFLLCGRRHPHLQNKVTFWRHLGS